MTECDLCKNTDCIETKNGCRIETDTVSGKQTPVNIPIALCDVRVSQIGVHLEDILNFKIPPTS